MNDEQTSKNPPPAKLTKALISLPEFEKERLTALAKAHGMTFSGFLRMAADEYVEKHGWE